MALSAAMLEKAKIMKYGEVAKVAKTQGGTPPVEILQSTFLVDGTLCFLQRLP